MLRQSIAFFKQLHEAFIKGDIKFILDNIIDEAEWELTGRKIIRGKNKILKQIEKERIIKPDDLENSNFITHGNKAAINGLMFRKNKYGKKKYYMFCHIYELNKFKNGKIKKITSYIVELKAK